MWTGTVEEQRKHAVELVEEGLSISMAADVAGVSRQCLHKWLKRYRTEGLEGLADRSRAPKAHANAVSEKMVRRVLRARRKYREGPRKIRHYLQTRWPNEQIPAASTIGIILKEHGYVEPRRRRARAAPTPTELTSAEASNDVWRIDFKGEFEVGRALCYPFTITDGFSRFWGYARRLARATSPPEPISGAYSAAMGFPA